MRALAIALFGLVGLCVAFAVHEGRPGYLGAAFLFLVVGLILAAFIPKR